MFYRERSRDLLSAAEAAGRNSGLRGLDLLRHLNTLECPWDRRVGPAAWAAWADELRAIDRKCRAEDAEIHGVAQGRLF